MDVNELYNLVKLYYGYKIHMREIDYEKKLVIGVLYDAFIFECDVNGRYGTFEAGIHIGNGVTVFDYLGKNISINSDKESIKKNLEIIDEYCRMKLPAKYLKAYYKAYVLDNE